MKPIFPQLTKIPLPMKVSETGIRVIAKYEGFRSSPYLDAVGVPTIGFGNTFYRDNTRVKMTDKPISEEKARELLKNIVQGFEMEVSKLMREVNQNQFDAVLSLVYNIGVTAFSRSTLLKRINENPIEQDIAYQFSRWNKAGGKVLLGLTRRRKEEAELYFK